MVWGHRSSPTNKVRLSQLGIHFASVAWHQKYVGIFSTLEILILVVLVQLLTVMTASRSSKRSLRIFPKQSPCCLPVLGNTGLVYCKCQRPSASTIVSGSCRCFSVMIKLSSLRCMMKRSHTDKTCEDLS